MVGCLIHVYYYYYFFIFLLVLFEGFPKGRSLNQGGIRYTASRQTL